MLDVKKTLAKLLRYKKSTFTPTRGSNYDNYGGCFYERYGALVHIHLGLSGLSQGAANRVYELPTEIRPPVTIFANGHAGSFNSYTVVEVRRDGIISIIPNGGTYCGADVFYILGGVVSRLLNLLTSKRGWAVC